MASVTFTRYWLSPASNMSLGRGFRLAQLPVTPQAPADIRQYGTRLRGISTGVKAHQQAISVFCDTRDDVTFLEMYEAATVLARDPRGRKFYAIYTDLNLTENPAAAVRVAATLTLNEVTYAEYV